MFRSVRARLDGKAVIVTGAARGIGRAIAIKLSAEAADTVLVDVAQATDGSPYPLATPSQLNKTAQRCRALGSSVIECIGDVWSRDQISGIGWHSVDQLGRIDIAVNKAGIAAPSGRFVYEKTDDEWDLMLDIDLKGAWRTVREVAPLIISQRPLARHSAHLSDVELLRHVEKVSRGYAHPELAEPKLSEIVLPALRVDVAMHESYRPTSAAPAQVPVTTLQGVDDALVTRDECGGWAKCTSRGCAHVEFEGGHMSLAEDLRAVFGAIGDAFELATSRRPSDEQL
ncbi:SDR family NAD(P)-dependent oxidoreductase [Streptomyces violaceusniger]